MASGSRARKAIASINPQNQNIETVHRIVAQILGLAGCGHCGRLAVLAIDFLGDPAPDLAKEGVISLQLEG